MAFTHYDIQLKSGKQGRWQAAKLFADKIVFHESTVLRSDVASYHKYFFNGYRLKTITGDIFFLRGSKALAGWYDHTAALRRNLSILFFVLSLLLGVWRPGLQVYPAVIVFSVLTALCGWLFHELLYRGVKHFVTGLLLFFMFGALPLVALLPFYVSIVFLGIVVFLFSIPLWLHIARKRAPSILFASISWVFVILVNFYWLQVAVKVNLDHRLHQASGALFVACDIAEGICTLEGQPWRLPSGWQMSKNNFLKRITQTDTPSQIQVANQSYHLTLPPYGDHGWFSAVSWDQNIFFSQTDEYIKNNRRFLWALYLGASQRFVQDGISWQVFHFFNPNKMKQENVAALYLPSHQQNAWVFLFTVPESQDVEYIISRILEGFM